MAALRDNSREIVANERKIRAALGCSVEKICDFPVSLLLSRNKAAFNVKFKQI